MTTTALSEARAVVAAAERASCPLDREYAYLFSDIEESTPLLMEMGDVLWMELLRRHDRVFVDRLDAFGGRVVKHQGDGLMMTFDCPVQALRFGRAVQQALAEDPVLAPRVRVRMGLHVGPCIEEGDDVFGQHVTFAARVVREGRTGEVTLSERVRRLAEEASGEFEFVPRGEVALQGFQGRHELYAVA